MNEKSSDAEERAVALRYDAQRDAAPRVVASGRGRVAERLVEIAKEAGVPIHVDSELVELLEVLDIDGAIPDELYGAVAEVLVFLFSLSRSSEQAESSTSNPSDQ